MKLYLVEHFFSVQGEGRYVGVPSIFLRFGGCNLRCFGFGEFWHKGKRILGCDTVRATNHKLFQDFWEEVTSLGYLINIIEDYLKDISYRPDIVLTGGEPMIYAQNPIFYEMVKWLVEHNFRVTIETNSTIAPSFEEFVIYKNITFAMAVKLSNSGEPKKRRIVPDAIKMLSKKGKNSFFKFTLDQNLIKEDAHSQIEEICNGYTNEIYCMPLGDNIKNLQLNALSVAEFCLKHGYNYSDRLHVRLWNREEKR